MILISPNSSDNFRVYESYKGKNQISVHVFERGSKYPRMMNKYPGVFLSWWKPRITIDFGKRRICESYYGLTISSN